MVVTFSQLAALCCPGVCADESTLDLALLQLQREKKAAVSLHDGHKVTGGGASECGGRGHSGPELGFMFKSSMNE